MSDYSHLFDILRDIRAVEAQMEELDVEIGKLRSRRQRLAMTRENAKDRWLYHAAKVSGRPESELPRPWAETKLTVIESEIEHEQHGHREGDNRVSGGPARNRDRISAGS